MVRIAMSSSVDHPRGASQRAGLLGALLLAAALVGYAVYELILWPRAGFPSDDMAVILGGIDTLRVGHWLKFGYAAGVALLTVALRRMLLARSSTASDLALLVGSGSVALFVASGVLGLRILEAADGYYPASLVDARATVLVRVVTQSLQQAGLLLGALLILINSAAGLRARTWPAALHWIGLAAGILLVAALALPYPLDLLGPLLLIIYAGLAARQFWKAGP
jgi:hypothetical protein